MTEEITYRKGEAKKDHLNSIFGNRTDSPTNSSGDLGTLNADTVKSAILNATSIVAIADNPDTDDVDETVIGDKREAAAYWYEAGVDDDGSDSKVDLSYNDAPSFNAADYSADNAIQSPYGPNLNIPTIDNDTVGAFTSNIDNPVLVIPARFNPDNEERFGTNKGRSENANSGGSLKGPGQFTSIIKSRALEPQLPPPGRANIDED